MKRVYFLVVAIAVAAAITSCKKDDAGGSSFIPEGKLTIKLETNASKVDKVKVFAEGYPNNTEIFSGSFDNGSITLALPATLADKCLTDMGKTDYANIPKGQKSNIKISNMNAKIGSVWIQAYKGNSSVDGLILGKVTKNGYVSGFIYYSDSDVSVTGKYDGESISVNLKKGYNIVYETNDATTTKDPGGMKWYLEYDFYEMSGH